MLVRRVVVAVSTAGLAACGGGASTAPSASPSASPSAARPDGVTGLVSASRCAALRDQVLVNARTRQAELAAGQQAQAQELARAIAAGVRAARAIRGCDVSDLPAP